MRPGTAIVVVLSALTVSAAVLYGAKRAADRLENFERRLPTLVSDAVRETIASGEVLVKAMDEAQRRGRQAQAEAQQQRQVEQERVAREQARAVRPATAGRDHVRGKAEARLSVIEYSDFECPFCKRFHSVPMQLLKEYPNDVNWIYRHLPLPFHNPNAQKQAEAAECAGELGGGEAFWGYTDRIYERTRSGGQGIAQDRLVPLAAEVGVDSQKFRECLESGKKAGRVQEDLDEGASLGIRGTPYTIILDNRTAAVDVISGARPYDQVKAVVARMLAGVGDQDGLKKQP